MKQLQDKVYVFPFMAGFVNVYFIETPEGLLLVDTGMSAGQMQQVVAEIQKAGFSLTDLKHIFITHAHNDHIGGLPYLQKLLPASTRTYAHRREAAIIRGEAPMIFAPKEALNPLMRLISGVMPAQIGAPARIDHEVKAGDKIAGLLEVVKLPGHAYGHCGLWWQEQKVLFGGDVVMRLPWGLSLPFAVVTPDMTEAKQSVKKVAALKLEHLYICHGAPLTQNTASTVQAFADRLKT